MKIGYFQKAISALSLAVLTGVVLFSVGSGTSATPEYLPPGTGIRPTFTGAIITGDIENTGTKPITIKDDLSITGWIKNEATNGKVIFMDKVHFSQTAGTDVVTGDDGGGIVKIGGYPDGPRIAIDGNDIGAYSQSSTTTNSLYLNRYAGGFVYVGDAAKKADLKVSGNEDVTGTLTVTGIATLKGATTISGVTSMDGKTTFNGTTHFDQDATFSELAKFYGTLDVRETISNQGNLNNGAVKIDDALQAKSLTTSDAVTVGGHLFLANNAVWLSTDSWIHQLLKGSLVIKAENGRDIELNATNTVVNGALKMGANAISLGATGDAYIQQGSQLTIASSPNTDIELIAGASRIWMQNAGTVEVQGKLVVTEGIGTFTRRPSDSTSVSSGATKYVSKGCNTGEVAISCGIYSSYKLYNSFFYTDSEMKNCTVGVYNADKGPKNFTVYANCWDPSI